MKPNSIRYPRRYRRGTTFVEVLVSALVLGCALAGIVSMWYFSYSITAQSSIKSQAYNIARQTIEQVRETGFWNTPEAPAAAPVVHYYNMNLSNVDATPSQAAVKVSTTVVSDTVQTGVTPTAPADTALRTVTVTVTSPTTGSTIYTTTTYLARAGI